MSERRPELDENRDLLLGEGSEPVFAEDTELEDRGFEAAESGETTRLPEELDAGPLDGEADELLELSKASDSARSGSLLDALRLGLEAKPGRTTLPSGELCWDSQGVRLHADGTEGAVWSWSEGEPLALNLSRSVQAQEQGWLSAALGRLPRVEQVLLCELRRSDGASLHSFALGHRPLDSSDSCGMSRGCVPFAHFLRLRCPADEAWLASLPRYDQRGEPISRTQLLELLGTLQALGVEPSHVASDGQASERFEQCFRSRGFLELMPAFAGLGMGFVLLGILGLARLPHLMLAVGLALLVLFSMLIRLQSVRLLRGEGNNVVLRSRWPFFRRQCRPLSVYSSVELRWEDSRRGVVEAAGEGETVPSLPWSQLTLSGGGSVPAVPLKKQTLAREQALAEGEQLARSLGLPLREVVAKPLRIRFPWLAYGLSVLLCLPLGSILANALTGDARYVLGGHFSGHAGFVSTLTGTLFGDYALLTSPKVVDAVALSNELPLALSASGDEVILWRMVRERELWRLAQDEREQVAAGEPSPNVRWLGFSSDGERFFIGLGQSVGVWQSFEQELVAITGKVLPPSSEALAGCAEGPKSTLLAWVDRQSASTSGAIVRVLNLEAPTEAPLALQLPPELRAVSLLSFSADCSHLLLALEAGPSGATQLGVFERDSGKAQVIALRRSESSAVACAEGSCPFLAALSPDGQRLAYITERDIVLLELDAPEQEVEMSGVCPRTLARTGPWQMAIVDEQRLLLVCPHERIPGLLSSSTWQADGVGVYLYSLTKQVVAGERVGPYDSQSGHGAAVHSFAVDSSGLNLLTGSADGTAALWRL